MLEKKMKGAENVEKDFLYPLRRIHGLLHDSLLTYKNKCDLKVKYRREIQQKRKHNSKTVFLVLTPEHTNLGDHAIAYAEAELLKCNGVDYVEITGKQLVELQKNKCLNSMNGYPILINGGGNLGTLWFDVEQLMRDIIRANPRSCIFILPNTIYYEDTEYGKREFEQSVSIYNTHKNLYIYAREQISYDKMKDVYRSVKLVPDMVLSMNWCDIETERMGCLLCLRKDCERLCTEKEEEQLYSMLQTVFGEELHYTDMHAMRDVQIVDRTIALRKKRIEFQKAALVVTDRLHGMILCAITGTPCIVINSRSPKVKGCYEWIRHLKYIKFCDNIDDILEVYQSIPSENNHYDNSHLVKYYNELTNDVLEKI